MQRVPFKILMICCLAIIYTSASATDTLAIARENQILDIESVVEFNKKDSIRKYRRKLPLILSGKFTYGTVFRSNDFVKDYGISRYKTGTLKFAIGSLGDRWQDIAYGMPYYGFGVSVTGFNGSGRLGYPISVYLLQGATITSITKKLLFNYEFNLGFAAGWKPYDPFDNPDNVAVGASVNIHVGVIPYLKWMLTEKLDINLGVEFTHYSNGASRMPNKGLNLGGVFIEASYNFNRENVKKRYNPNLRPPEYDTNWKSEFLFNISTRQVTVGTAEGVPSKYIDRNFTVLGFSYALLRAPHYRFRYGLSADLMYDESAGVTAAREKNPHDDKWYDRVKKGKMHERFALGISAKGELVHQGYSIFGNLGYDIIHGNKSDHRFYQVIGVKIYLRDNLFGTFGIRSTYFSKAQFLYWSLGYTLDHTPKWKQRAKSAKK